MDLIDPSDLTLTGWDGKERTYILSRIPAVQCREIVFKYPLSALPKLGDYQVNEEVMLKLMNFVAVQVNEKTLRLSTRILVDNHIPDFETLAKIEFQMLEKNLSFFGKGQGLTSFEGLARKMIAWTLKTWTALSEQSSRLSGQPTTNSGQSTP